MHWMFGIVSIFKGGASKENDKIHFEKDPVETERDCFEDIVCFVCVQSMKVKCAAYPSSTKQCTVQLYTLFSWGHIVEVCLYIE